MVGVQGTILRRGAIASFEPQSIPIFKEERDVERRGRKAHYFKSHQFS